MSEPVAPSTEDVELRAHVEQALSAAYELDCEIGRGGMGIVYRARDRRLKRHVAIKLLPPELSFRRDVRSRFLREAETAAQLSHPNIVPIYSVDEVGNLVFFVMACIDGDNLAKMLATRGPLPVADVRRWLLEVADALAYAHARGVVHRDIKPDNILLDGIDGRALVTDFGIARAASDSGEGARLTATGMAIGTPAYMSPEQASGDRDLDARSDLYSLGIVAYQMLCGEPPFLGNSTPALLVKHLAETPVPISQRRADVPPDLAAIVMRLLEKNPDHRFQSGADLVQALRTGTLPPSLGSTGAGASPVTFNGAPIGGMPMGTGSRGAAPSAPGYQAPAYTARTLTTQPAANPSSGDFGTPPAYGGASYGTANDDGYTPSALEVARWEAPQVVGFRRKLGPYLFISLPLLAIGIVTGGDNGFGGIATLWTVYIAWKYAKLWSDGFDWRDVLRQPRNRMLGEAISDLVDSVVATFSRTKREQLRAHGRLRNPFRGALSASPPGTPAGASVRVQMQLPRGGAAAAAAPAPVRDDELGGYLPLVRGARDDREEITRLLATMPPADRAKMPDVARTAVDLVQKMEYIARDLARLEAEHPPEGLARVDAEITTLEAEANPLDTSRSEGRVRRLAQLRRDRRAHLDAQQKLEQRRGQVESCRLALENVRLDLVRLRTGNSSVQSVTLVAEQAMAMARDVDIAVQAATEVQGLTSGRASSR
ncbi:MAG: serine/threonine protein kinase [Gemmatimonadetes bacterium]|nr:serine/threonine protein kinase [Gemmatimonadota bacterium]